jgi:hypothetical protein
VTGIDWPARNLIEIVYHLFSLQNRHQIVLKVEADRAQPSVPSVQGVWKAANWLEREVFDMLGVISWVTRTCGGSCCPTTGSAILCARTTKRQAGTTGSATRGLIHW